MLAFLSTMMATVNGGQTARSADDGMAYTTQTTMLAGPKKLLFHRGTSVELVYLWEAPVHNNSSWLQQSWASKPGVA